MLFNVNCNRSKFPQGITWLEIFPGWRERPLQSEDEMFEAMMLWTKVEPLPS